MHLVPPERRDRRVLDDERVCKAIEALGNQDDLATWATRFSILGDRSRLTLLLSIAEAGPISVTDLATATGINDTTVSQSLRLLRAAGTVVGRRDGRMIRYELADREIGQLLRHLTKAEHGPRHAAQ